MAVLEGLLDDGDHAEAILSLVGVKGIAKKALHATSAPGLGSPLPHLHRDWAHPCNIGLHQTGLAPSAMQSIRALVPIESVGRASAGRTGCASSAAK